MTPFTTDELNILQSAVQLWAKEPQSEGSTTGLFNYILDSFDPKFKGMSHAERKEHSERKAREEKNKIDALLELRREDAILLQAKLIQLKKANANT